MLFIIAGSVSDSETVYEINGFSGWLFSSREECENIDEKIFTATGHGKRLLQWLSASNRAIVIQIRHAKIKFRKDDQIHRWNMQFNCKIINWF